MLALVRIFSASSFIISPVLSIKSCKPLSLFFHKGIVYMILFRYTYHALSVNSSYRICISMSCAMITFIWQPGYPDLLFRGCMPFNSLTFLFIRCITAWISASLIFVIVLSCWALFSSLLLYFCKSILGASWKIVAFTNSLTTYAMICS